MLGFPIIFLQRLRLATSYLAHSWDLQRTIIKTTRRKTGRWPGLGELTKIWRFSFNIYTMAEASNFKFGTQLGFAKALHKSTPRRKSEGGLVLGELHKILRFHFNIYTTAEARDFKFGTQLGFAKAHHKTTPRGKVGVALG